jgi:hypothetical protein
MTLNMRLIQTSGTATLEVPEDIASDLQEAYDSLKTLPVNHAVTVNFDTKKEADLFVRQANAWAGQNNLKFFRKGDIKGEPATVTFRIYVPRNQTDSSTADAA